MREKTVRREQSKPANISLDDFMNGHIWEMTVLAAALGGIIGISAALYIDFMYPYMERYKVVIWVIAAFVIPFLIVECFTPFYSMLLREMWTEEHSNPVVTVEYTGGEEVIEVVSNEVPPLYSEDGENYMYFEPLNPWLRFLKACLSRSMAEPFTEDVAGNYEISRVNFEEHRELLEELGYVSSSSYDTGTRYQLSQSTKLFGYVYYLYPTNG